MDEQSQTHSRKLDHVRIVLDENVAAKGISTDFGRYRMPHEALPELDMQAIDLRTTFFGKRLHAPILISSMTGGAHDVTAINTALAQAAQTLGIAMGVGSQRAAIGNPDLASTYRIRHIAPDVLLFANLGAVQLNYGYGVDECQRAVDMIEADALILHLNPLQEAVQPEGNTNFSGLLPKIAAVCHALTVPVIIKEVGNGIGPNTARRLIEAGVAAIDVAGAGGTSWSEVERFRHTHTRSARTAGAFADWGIPTSQAIRQVRNVLPHTPLIGSGGIRSGVDIAKAIALGADLGGTAKPALVAAVDAKHSDAVITELQGIIDELRVAMFCSGCADLDALRQLPLEYHA
ncbi:MAG: type 2 isopentenyl-diphosphate Delta-isomerase [Roseiflexaceae bacterium]